MAKYWDDRDLMTKIHYKMEAMKIHGETEQKDKVRRTVLYFLGLGTAWLKI